MKYRSDILREFSPAEKSDFMAMASDFYASGAALNSVPARHFERTFDRFFGTDTLKGLALTDGRETVGYCIITLFWSNEFGGTVAFLDELYIRPEYRGRGLGTRALAAIKEYSASLNCAAVRLEVNPAHPDTIRLYGRNGFEPLRYTQMLHSL